jgi:hypothetical protein
LNGFPYRLFENARLTGIAPLLPPLGRKPIAALRKPSLVGEAP